MESVQLKQLVEIRRQGIGMWRPYRLRFRTEEDFIAYLDGHERFPHSYDDDPIPSPDGAMHNAVIELRTGTKEWAINLAERAIDNPNSLLNQPDQLSEIPTIYEIDPTTGDRRVVMTAIHRAAE